MVDERNELDEEMDLEQAYVLGKVNFDAANYKNALYCINKTIELSPETGSFYFNRALTYLKLGEKDKAEEDLNKASQLDSENEDILKVQAAEVQAAIYFESQQYIKAVSQFDIMIDSLSQTSVNLSNLYLQRALLLTFLLKDVSLQYNENDNNQTDSEVTDDGISARIITDIHSAINQDVEKKYFSVWTCIEKECENNTFQEKLRKIFTCVYAIRMLHSSIDEKLIHYTKTEYITSFFNFNDSNCDANSISVDSSQKKSKDKYLKYRAHNSAYMNDPGEGVIFRDLLVNKLNSDKSKSDLFLKYWGELYEPLNELYESKTYLLCFSDESAHDVLPMWSMYGGDGTGCCMSFKKNLLFPIKNPHEQKIQETQERESNLNKIYNFINHPDALSVFYCSSDECINVGGYIYNQLVEHILNLEEEIRKENEDLKAKKEEAEHSNGDKKHFIILNRERQIRKINTLVKIMLDQIRFLYKDKSYQHEHELRVVRFADTQKSNIKLGNPKNVGDIPHLYMDVETNIKYEDVTILLGPKVDNPHKISTYLKYIGVGEVMMSKIRFR